MISLLPKDALLAIHVHSNALTGWSTCKFCTGSHALGQTGREFSICSNNNMSIEKILQTRERKATKRKPKKKKKNIVQK